MIMTVKVFWNERGKRLSCKNVFMNQSVELYNIFVHKKTIYKNKNGLITQHLDVQY